MAKFKAADMPQLMNATADELGVDLGTEVTEKNWASLSVVLTQPATANSFWTFLINKIYETVVMDKLWTNPLAELKSGDVPIGEVIEDIAFNPAKVESFEDSSVSLFDKVVSDAKVQFHGITDRSFTVVTLAPKEIREAFSSPSALAKALNAAVNTLYNGQYIYEYESMRNTITAAINGGYVTIESEAKPTATDGGADAFINKVFDLSDAFQFPSTDYNKYSAIESKVGAAAFKTWTDFEDLVIVLPYKVKNKMSVYSLAKAFNKTEIEIKEHIIAVDTLGKYVTGEPEAQTEQEINALICDRRFFQFRSYLQELAEQPDARHLTRNYFNHFWNSFDISLLCNAVALVEPLN